MRMLEIVRHETAINGHSHLVFRLHDTFDLGEYRQHPDFIIWFGVHFWKFGWEGLKKEVYYTNELPTNSV